MSDQDQERPIGDAPDDVVTPDGEDTTIPAVPEDTGMDADAGDDSISEIDALLRADGPNEIRRYVTIVITIVAAAIAAGHTLRQPTFMTANDISRWCTVWSLLERGTYAIDECPWQVDTQDKIYRPRKSPGAAPTDSAERHYYSSKPALISTLIAGILYPARRISGVPLDKVTLQERAERWTQKPDPNQPGKLVPEMVKPRDPVKWPVYGFYFKPVLLLINVVPFAFFLVYFARVLDRYATNDWSWYFSLAAAAFGTYLLPYTQTLNNHTLGAFAAFFALYQFLRIWDDRAIAGWRFVLAGFFAGCTAATELPALAFPALLCGMLLIRYPLRTPLFFVPAALIPLAALVGAQHAEFGEWFYFPYEAFGSQEYLYPGSLWQTPLELDWFNDHQEPYRIYIFHMTLGHHGIFSLTPIFFFSAWGAMRLLGGRRLLTLCIILTGVTTVGLGAYYLRDPGDWEAGGPLFKYTPLLMAIPILLGLLALLSAIPWLRGMDRPMEALAWMTAVLTIVILAFYAWTPKARNYGGSAQGLRWVMWLIPFWLLLLPRGIEMGRARGWHRRLALFCLAMSALSVGYAMRNPWSHPWILDALEQLGLYPLIH